MSTVADTFVPYKNVPGPPRLEMERADNSDTVNTDRLPSRRNNNG